jgi:hypothetical protein
MKKSGKYNELQTQVNAIANNLTRLNTQYELKTSAIEEETANLKSIMDSIETVHYDSLMLESLIAAHSFQRRL